MRKEFTFLSVLLFLIGSNAFSQINGLVQEADGGPALGAKVEIKNTGAFTRTNDKGRFELSTAKVGDTLIITNLDQNSEEIIAIQNLIFKFPAYDTDTKDIEAITIIGTIEIPFSQQIGATEVLKQENFASIPYASFDEALSGKVAGLNFTSNGGQPGAASHVIIRGINSISGSSNPLYVIDGIPVGRGIDSSELLGGYSSFSPLAGIDPNSIESVTVLKDLASTSLYGAQGANGVILVKTKTGKYNQKTRFSFTTETGFQEIAFDKHHWMTSEEYIRWGGLATAGSAYINGVTDAYDNLDKYENEYRDFAMNPINGLGWDGITNTNWDKAVRRNSSVISQYSFNASGGGENTAFNLGASYYKNTPLIKNSKFDRTSVNLGLTHRVSDELNFKFNGSISNVRTDTYDGGGSYANPWTAGWAALPFYKVKNPDGTYNNQELNNYNFVELLESDFLKGDMTTYLGSIGMEYEFIPDVKFMSHFSAQNQVLNEKSWWNQYTGNGSALDRNGLLQVNNIRIFDYDWNNFLQFHKIFNNKHDFTLDVGMDFQEHRRRFEFAAKSDFPEYSKPELNWGNKLLSIDGNKESWTQISYIGRLAYTFDRKYIATFNFRRDGNSTFGRDKKWGNFWNVGIMWNITDEDFLIDNKIIDKLRLRANYGIGGNATTASWGSTNEYKSTLANAQYNNLNAPVLYIGSAGNEDLRWEKSKQLDIGIDFSLFNNRLTGIIDYYNRKTEDLISLKTIPYTTGGPNSYYANVASIRNRGLEFTLTGVPLKTDNFYWSITGIISTNKSKILKVAEGAHLEAYGKRLDVGCQVGEYFMYEWAGVNPENGSAIWYTNNSALQAEYNGYTEAQKESLKEILYYDSRGRLVTSDLTMARKAYLGSTNTPVWQASLSNELSYKGFKLAFLFTGAFDYKVYDTYTDLFMSDGSLLGAGNQESSLLDSWTPNNPYAPNPIQIDGNNTNSSVLSSRFLRKGDHIRLKEVKLSYTFGKEQLRGVGIDAITIYVRGTNLITWAFDSKLKSDPETMAAASSLQYGYPEFYRRGMYDFSSPMLKTYSFGVNVNF